MEPPDVVYKGSEWSFHMTHIVMICIIPNSTENLQYYSCNKTMRIRGGMDNPKDDEKTDEIAALKNKRFFWDGLPRIDFNEAILQPLENGLATVMVKGWSLLDACRQRDAGGLFGNPSRMAALQPVIDESVSRNKKAFASIMNYTSSQSFFYRMCMREYREDGITVLAIMPRFGRVIIPQVITDSRTDFWKRMSFEALRIPLDQKGWFFWAMVVQEVGRKMNQTGDAIFEKYVSGWPKFMDKVGVNAKTDDDATLKWPATWGGLYPMAPNAATAHPYAGFKSPELFAKRYFEFWCSMCTRARTENNTPFVNMTWDTLSVCQEVDDFVNLLHHYDVTPEMKCTACGGLGHSASFVDNDGVRQECLTKRLERERNGGASSIEKPKPKYDKQHAKQIKSLETSYDAILNRIEELEALKLDFQSNYRKRSDKPSPRAHATETTTDDSDSLAPECDEDDSSDGSHVHEMADYAQPKKRFQKRSASPFPRRN